MNIFERLMVFVCGWIVGFAVVAVLCGLVGTSAPPAAAPSAYAPAVLYVYGDEIQMATRGEPPMPGTLVHFPGGGESVVTSVSQHGGKWYVYFHSPEGE